MTDNEVFRKYTDQESFSKIISYDSVSQMWKHSVSVYGENKAVLFDGKEYTYNQLEEDVALYRTFLISKGIYEGDRVALFSPNSYDFVKAFLALTTLGVCAAIFPAHLDEAAVFGCCKKFGVKALVYNPTLEDKIKAVKDNGICAISTAESSDTKTSALDCKGDRDCVIMFTGGTTGKSKGALLTNQAVLQGTKNGCYGTKDVFNQRYILVLPLSHVFGLIRNLLTCLYTGSTLFICKNNKDMFKDIAIFKPTILVTVPALAEMALNLSRQFKRNMLGDQLKTIICGAATVSPYLISEYGKMGVNLLPGYGMTETANLVSGNPRNQERPESVGYLYENQEYKVVNGELWLKGKNLLKEYVGEPDENASAFQDGWFKTGDLVRFDQDGLMYIVGRIKEIIILANGENVSPAEVEAKFNELDCIQDSQVFEDRDDMGNHFLALEVVPRNAELEKIPVEDKENYLKEELEKINSTLLPYQRVSKITIRKQDFERSPSMKVLRYHKC